MNLFPQTLLSPYLTPEQAALLRYEQALPPASLAGLGVRLRGELAALRTLVPEPLARDPIGFARRSDYWAGSLLCADLSGFTALTERLAADGLRGIEELSAIINRLFGALLAEIERYGGTVLKFGGDAITAFFEADQIGPDHGAAACTAALALQQRMEDFATLETSAGPHRLRLRIGVHAGSPFVAILGDGDRRELLVTGRAVNRVALLQERAAPGEVLVSAETLVALESARSAARPGGQALLLALPVLVPRPRPALPPIATGSTLAQLGELAAQIATLRPFLPSALPHHVLHPDRRAGGEFRPVTALFIHVTSFSGLLSLLGGAEELAARALGRYYSGVRQVIGRYGGEINKLDIGSAGDKLLALFGAPLAHEDDPLRAAEATLDLQTALEQTNQEIRQLLAEDLAADGASGTATPGLWRAVDLSLRQRIGVATGNVFAGTVGAPQRREYTVIGQTVNLAARLMASAEPGTALLAPATAAAVRDAIEIQPLPPLALKGFARPVLAALALRRRAEQPGLVRRAGPLIGRDSELVTLRELARQAFAGIGQVAAISGEAGIGKSRLAAACLDELSAAGRRCITLSCRSYAQHTPYSLMRDLLTRLLDLPGDPAALGPALSAAVGATAPEFAALVPLLETVFGSTSVPTRVPEAGKSSIPPAEVAATASPVGSLERTMALMPKVEQRERLHDLIVTLVLGAAQAQPLVLLIDDMHWADASSLDVVWQLARLVTGAPLLLMLVYRADDLALAPWAERAAATVLQLEALDQPASRALLAALLDAEPPPALEPLLERAQGSPFFLEALVQHLIDRAALRRDLSGAWQLVEPLSALSAPATIEPALAAQLDRLDEETRELVQVAAVIGTRISYAVLAGVYSQARQPARRLMDLVRSGILISEEHDPGAPFRFRQTLLRDVAYQSILYTQRRELHRRVAERITTVYAGQEDLYAAELAHHYQQAGDGLRAGAYALRAARYSRERYALPEALAAYRQALVSSAALSADEPLRVQEELADTEVLAGLYDQALERYRALLASSVQAGDLARSALQRKIGGVYEQQGMFGAALHWLRRARWLVERRADDEGRTPNDAGSGKNAERRTANDRRGARDGAGQTTDAAVGLAVRAAPFVEVAAAHERAQICSAIGWVYFRRGEARRAGVWLERALDALADGDVGLLTERARIFNRLGGVAWMSGDLAAAQTQVERSLADFTASGDLLGQADAQNNLGILAEQRGDWAGAITSYSAALATNQQLGRRRAAALCRLNLGAAQLHQGDAAAAQPLLEQAAVQAREVGDTLHEVMALRWLGRALTRLACLPEAAAALVRALTLAREHDLLLEQLDAHTALGELALAAGDLAGAHSSDASGWALYPAIERDTLEAGLFLRFAAQLAECAGDAPRGATLRAKSQAILGALGMG